MQEILDTALEGLRLAGDMAWRTWWALVLGFTIAGAVESLVSERAMARVLGGGGPKAVLLGTLFGAASSSCSFGAVATAKSLFKKGASPEASLAAFQFASTNLVIELGLVMWVLLGWQFVAANFVSGLMLIAVLVLVFRFLVPAAWFEQAREYVHDADSVRDPQCGMEVDPQSKNVVRHEGEAEVVYFCSTGCRDAWLAETDAEKDWRHRLVSRAGWVRASRSAFGEWRMLYKDIIAGFVIAGLIGAAVPRTWWSTLFGLFGQGGLVAVVFACAMGVTIGVVTFVCSVGNVPFALILWRQGIPFGGIMSFIFADLIVPTITDAYRRYYGWRIAAVLFLSVGCAAILVGVLIHYLWSGLGLVPASGNAGGTAPHGYTLYLNLAATPLFALQVWLGTRR